MSVKLVELLKQISEKTQIDEADKGFVRRRDTHDEFAQKFPDFPRDPRIPRHKDWEVYMTDKGKKRGK